MYWFFIILTLIASILVILAILVQSPKSGMAANFGASNQVMGVRQTADFLEKFTWGAAVVILVLALSTVGIQSLEKSSSADSTGIEQQDAAGIPGADDKTADSQK